jgi:hypothetical protein
MVGVGEIASHGEATPFRPSHQIHRGCGVSTLVQIIEGDIRPFLGKGRGDGTADAAIGAGDEGHLAVQQPTTDVPLPIGLAGWTQQLLSSG